MEKVRNIYDRLFEFEKNKQQGQVYPIHKPLRFSEEEKTKGITDVSDLIIEQLPIGQELRILDAGCGVGYALLKLGKYPRISGLGISLSEKELQMAQESALGAGLANRFSFKLKSYDEDFQESFDVIFCIESLKHSPNWKKTLANLEKHLKVGGSIFLVEDYYSGNKSSYLSKSFQKSWSVPDMFSEEEMAKELAENRLKTIKKTNLDTLIWRKNVVSTYLMQQILGIILFFIPKNSLKTLLEIYRGVILMDYFYARNLLSYQLLHLRKPA